MAVGALGVRGPGWALVRPMRWRAVWGIVLLCGVALGLAWAPGDGRFAAVGGGGSRAQGLSGLPLAAQGSVSAALGGADAGYRVVGFRAVNRVQQLRLGFSAAGVMVASGSGRAELSLVGLGRETALRRVGAASPHVRGNRVWYRRRGVREWFANGPLGLEQGFRVAARPDLGRGPLVVAVSVAGNLRASLDGGGGVLLSGAGAVLRYRGLWAVDARGRALHAWLAVRDHTMLVRVDDRAAAYPLRIDPLIQGARLVGTGGSADAQQGFSVALSSDGGTALIGGPFDNGLAGAAWVFTRAGGVWTQQGAKLVGTGAVGVARQGWSVALSSDGNTALSAGFADNGNTGAAWVFTRSGGVWTQQGAKLVGTGAGSAGQGLGAALSGDGNTALIGGPVDNNSLGAAWVFTRSGGVWSQQGAKLVGTGATSFAHQGNGVALSSDGSTALIGGFGDNGGTGAAWVFTRSGVVWTQQGAKLVGAGANGIANQADSVALSGDGNTALIGGPFDNGQAGAAWVFTRLGGVWSQQGAKLVGTGATGTAEQGASVALSSDGNAALIGGPADNGTSGAAWMFTQSGGTWTQQGAKLVGTGATGSPDTGGGVALSGDGATALIGGPLDNGHAGAALAFCAVPPSLQSSPSATFTTGQAGSFTVRTSGCPAPTLTESGALPQGVRFTDNGDGTTTLSGTPAAGSGGAYTFAITAANGVLPDATQSFTLTVDQPPAITSLASTTFTIARAGSFTVTATGYPTPSIVAAASLPRGVSLTDNHNGSARLSGTPAAGSGGAYRFTITATNGSVPDATQTFTMTVRAPPIVTITRPIDGARLTRGQRTLATYRCQEPTGGPGIASCHGSLPNGARLDTAHAGRHSLIVTATSKDGLSSAKTVTYTIQLPSNRLAVSQIRTFADGTIILKAKVPGPGRIDVLETAWTDNLARTALVLQPAQRRFLLARALRTTRRATTLQIKLTPNARGRMLVTHHRYRVTLRLWVTYTPSLGLPRSIGFRGLHLGSATP